MKEELLNFLKSQELLVIASKGEDIWITNVYYCIDDDFNIYFVSSENTKHSQQIINNSEIAFSITWFNPKNHKDRKAVQGKGICEICKEDFEITKGVELHNLNFPEFKERINFDWIKNNDRKSRVWKIKPSFMKFWNDELFGEDGTKEISFE